MDQDRIWESQCRTSYANHPEPLNEAAALVAAGQSWRQVVLTAVLSAPAVTPLVGGVGGGSFDMAGYAFAPDLAALRVRSQASDSVPSGAQQYPDLAAPCLSPSTCRVLRRGRLWVSPDNTHIRAIQLQYADPTDPGASTWTLRAGAGEENSQNMTQPTATLALEEGEHITCVRCYVGYCSCAE